MAQPEVRCPITANTRGSSTARRATEAASNGSERSSETVTSTEGSPPSAVSSSTAMRTARSTPCPDAAMSPVIGTATRRRAGPPPSGEQAQARTMIAAKPVRRSIPPVYEKVIIERGIIP